MSSAKAQAALAQVKQQLANLERQIEVARGRASRYRVYIEVEQELAGVSAPKAGEDTERGGREGAPTSTEGIPRPEGKKALVWQAAEEIVRSHGSAMKPAELVERLANRGIVISEDPKRATGDLSGLLKKHPTLFPSRKHGWRLRDWVTLEELGLANRTGDVDGGSYEEPDEAPSPDDQRDTELTREEKSSEEDPAADL
jgi:hypothetical protein